MMFRATQDIFWIGFGQGDGMALVLLLRVEDDGSQFAEFYDAAEVEGDAEVQTGAAPIHAIDLTDAASDPAAIEAAIAGYYDALESYDPATHGPIVTVGDTARAAMAEEPAEDEPEPETAEGDTDDSADDSADDDTEVVTDAIGTVTRERKTPSCNRALAILAKNPQSPDLWTEMNRTEANLCAMEILASVDPSDMTDQDRRLLRTYSGWGGLHREPVMDRFPEGVPVPEERGLIHEYYTPTIVAREAVRVVRERLATIPTDENGKRLALEPSAGIGRFIDAMGDSEVDWTAVEYSAVSAMFLKALHPSMSVYSGPFEEWVAKRSYETAGKIGLVLSNPPYPKVRGVAKSLDPAKSYQEESASAYFLRRGLDMLAAGGLGVYLIPAGFMGGKGDASRELRQKVLRRHHVLAAFRLPSLTFPGANLVIDLIFFRARGGELPAVLPSDQFILDGTYFRQFPSHILGVEENTDDHADEEDNDKSATGTKKKKGRFDKYKVTGKFTKLPPFEDRPLVSDVVAAPYSLPAAPTEKVRKRRQHVDVSGMIPAVAQACRLGVRTDSYFSRLSAASSNAHVEAWPELVGDLRAWALEYGNPHRHSDVLNEVSEQNTDAQAFLTAFDTNGELTEAISNKPTWRGHYNGKPGDIAGLCDHLYRGGSALTLEVVAARLAEETRWSLSDALGAVEASLPALYAVGWRLEGDSWRELLPVKQSLMGRLWARYDRCVTLQAESAHPALRDGKVWGSLSLDRIAEQTKELRATIGPRDYTDISSEAERTMSGVNEKGETVSDGTNGRGDIDPSQGWMPLDLITEWANEWNAGMREVKLVRVNGMLMQEGVDPSDASVRARLDEWSMKFRHFIGWANTDYDLFNIRVTENEANAGLTTEGKRRDWETPVLRSFRGWVSADTRRQERIADAYNRTFLGHIPYVYDAEPIHIERWGSKIRLNDHQVRGVRKVIANRIGLLAFDVGVGKTFAGIATIARARQEGWVKRPIVVVPNTIVWKWDKDFKLCLPDYRVLVIGSSEVEVPFSKVYGVDKNGKSKDRTIIVYDPDGTRRRVLRTSDDEAERGQKWRDFQAGRYDVAIVAYSMLARTELDRKFIEEYARNAASIQRSLTARLRNAKKKAQTEDNEIRVNNGRPIVMADGKKDPKRRKVDAKKQQPLSSERQKAIANENMLQWISEVNSLPKDQKYDHGIMWRDIGVDMIVMDEAQNFKNLYLPISRTESGPWKFMGNEGAGAIRAWQLDFRIESIRQRNGGAGVVLLSATPAKNSPLEFYNIIQYLDRDIWQRFGINDPEAFIDRYIVPGPGYFAKADGTMKEGTVAKGFKNLDEIRGAIFRYGDFVTAEAANIPLPATILRYIGDDGRSFKMEMIDGKATWFDPDGVETFVTKVGLSMSDEQRIMDDHWRAVAAAAKGPQDKGKALRAMSMRHLLSIHPDLTTRGMETVRRLNEETGEKETVEEETSFWKWDNAAENKNFETVKFTACAKAIVQRLSCGHVVSTSDAESTVTMLVGAGVPEEKILVVPDGDGPINFSRFPLGRIRAPGDYEVLVCSESTYQDRGVKDHVCSAHAMDGKTEEKQSEICKQVFRARTCGHIVFCDSVAAHVWIKQTLVKYGVPADRIAILNAESAKEPSDRQNLAERFNGNPDVKMEPEFDVIICNQVAYEGIDLQARTCAIHHIDLPHDPSTLQQRNGRGVRQGNTMGAIEINYYLLQCSDDGSRFTNINGKRGWMVSLLVNQDRSTNNPAANMSPLDQLALLTCDVEQAKAMFAQREKEQEDKNRERKIVVAVTELRRANGKFRRAEDIFAGVETTTLARSEGEEALAGAMRAGKHFEWDWREIAFQVRDRGMLIPYAYPAPLIGEGMKAREAVTNKLVQFGKLIDGGGAIAVCHNAHEGHWIGELSLSELEKKDTARVFVVDGLPGAELGWEDAEPRHFQNILNAVEESGLASVWERRKLARASDEWLTRFWNAVGADCVMRSDSRGRYVNRKPIVFVRAGEGFKILAPKEVEIVTDVLPPTNAGFAEFIERAAKTKRSAMTLDDGRDIVALDGTVKRVKGKPLLTEYGEEYTYENVYNAVQLWWGRRFPSGIYKVSE